MATSKKAQAKYEKKCKQLKIKLSPAETDLIDFLESLDEPKATLIKRLIRDEMARRAQK